MIGVQAECEYLHHKCLLTLKTFHLHSLVHCMQVETWPLGYLNSESVTRQGEFVVFHTLHFLTN